MIQPDKLKGLVRASMGLTEEIPCVEAMQSPRRDRFAPYLTAEQPLLAFRYDTTRNRQKPITGNPKRFWIVCTRRNAGVRFKHGLLACVFFGAMHGTHSRVAVFRYARDAYQPCVACNPHAREGRAEQGSLVSAS